MIHWEKKFIHFDLKSWVTGGTKAWPGKVGKRRIFDSYWLNIESQIGSTLGVKLILHWESNWFNIESQIDSTLKVKFTQHWESNWRNIESQIDSNILQLPTFGSKSNWLNIESPIDSTLRFKLTQHWESYWLKYSPVTHFVG